MKKIQITSKIGIGFSCELGVVVVYESKECERVYGIGILEKKAATES
mgnify:CR=1 FL=1